MTSHEQRDCSVIGKCKQSDIISVVILCKILVDSAELLTKSKHRVIVIKDLGAHILQKALFDF